MAARHGKLIACIALALLKSTRLLWLCNCFAYSQCVTVAVQRRIVPPLGKVMVIAPNKRGPVGSKVYQYREGFLLRS